MDPLIELFKAVDISVAAAIGVVIALVVDQGVSAILNRPTLFGHPNPFYHWDTDRVMPFVTLGIGGTYGWLLGSAPGWQDNLKSGLLYGAVALAISRIVRKSFLVGTPPRTP